MRPSWNNRYYVLEVLEEHAKHSELEALSAYLKTPPKYLHTDRGRFPVKSRVSILHSQN